MLNIYDLRWKKHFCYLSFLIFMFLFQNSYATTITCTDAPDLDAEVIPEAEEERFVGAELYAEFAEGGRAQIILKKYYYCENEAIPSSQVVVIHERDAKLPFSKLILEKTNESISEKQPPLHCDQADNQNNCLKVVTFSAGIDLAIMPGGYDVVWMQKDIDEISNALPVEEQHGISLTIFIPDPMTLKSNSMPQARMLPGVLFCSGQSYELDLSAEDKDGDKVTYSLSDPFSFITSSEESVYFSEAGYVDTPAIENRSSLSDEVLFRRPPFLSLQELASPYLNTSLFTIDEQSGRIEFTPNNSQKHFLGVTITDERDGEILSQHQLVFLIESN